jgi:hypothetical protein
MEQTEKIVKLWKELGIDHINFNFNCGGDSMGDTNIEIFDKENEWVESQELVDYFDRETYNNVDFYVNSDGHYQGESGCVEITLNEDEDDFYYIKNAQSEWSERFDGKTKVSLTDEEAAFVSEFVDNLNGEEGNFTINYKKDFILTDKQEKLVESLEEKIIQSCYDFEPEDAEGEATDWFVFTTNEDNEDLVLVGNDLTLTVSRDYTIYRDSD